MSGATPLQLPRRLAIAASNIRSEPASMGQVHLSSDHKEIPIIIDSGASVSISPVREDFVGQLRHLPGSTIRGINSVTTIDGIGDVEWTIRDLHGNVPTI